MSAIYIYRLRSIRDDFFAARTAIAYYEKHWDTPDVIASSQGLSRKHFEQASRSLEITFYVRLYAEFGVF